MEKDQDIINRTLTLGPLATSEVRMTLCLHHLSLVFPAIEVV